MISRIHEHPLLDLQTVWYISLAILIPDRRVQSLTGSYMNVAVEAADAYVLKGPLFIPIKS